MRLPDVAALKGAFERLTAQRASAEDRAQVQAALAGGVLSIATGERAVTFGGSVDGAVVVTGDGNVVVRIDASGTAALEWLLQRSRPSPVHQLPADVADFAGRGAQVEALLRLLSAPGGRVAISAIEGMAGLGKTTLAMHVAHHLSETYSDGQIVVDMAGTSAAPLQPAQALAGVIRAFEPLMQLPETAVELQPIYLSTLRGRRVLIVLDNALDADQVAPLVPPETCALIVTARRRIALAGLTRVDLDLLAANEATDLLQSIVGPGRAEGAELSRIAQLCGFLPLALRVAGMFLDANPHWSATDFIATLADERERLDRLRLEGSAPLDVAASLSLSVHELRAARPDLADRWHELAAFPAGFDTDAAAAIWEQPAPAARDALGLLLSRSMVMYDPAQWRWRLHDLMRDVAGHPAAVEALGASADMPARLAAARRRHAEHYHAVVAATEELYLKGGTQAVSGLALFDRERRNIEWGYAWAADRAMDDPVASRLCVSYPNVGAHVLRLRRHPRQRIVWLETAVTAARQLADRRGEGDALSNLGRAYADLGESRRAIAYYERALAVARDIDDRRGEGNALSNLGLAYAELGEPRRAIEHHEQALTIARETGDRRREGNALGNLGRAYADLGKVHRAVEHQEKALAIAREIGNPRGEAIALSHLGIAYRELGETRRAIDHLEQALAITREIGDGRLEGSALGNLGIAYHNLGDSGRAIELYNQYLAIAREIGDRRGEGLALGSLGLAYASLGETRHAIEHYEQTLAISREIGDRHAAGATFGNLGNAYRALGEPQRAIGHYERALAIAQEIGDRHAEGAALGNLGLVYQTLGDTRRAVEHYERHLAIARGIGDRQGEGAALGNLGNIYADLGETRRAIDHFEQALVFMREAGTRRHERATLVNLGNAHSDLGEFHDAIDCFEQGLTVAREIADRRGEADALNNLGNAHAELREDRRALELLGQALKIYVEIDSPQAARVQGVMTMLEREGGA
jgi:tetratricopeptide (TPR) repeat protein